MQPDEIQNYATAASLQVTPAMFSSNPETQSLATAMNSLATAVAGLAELLRDRDR